MATPISLANLERVILVTGSTDGIGKETATTLARNPKNLVVVHGKSTDRVAATVKHIKESTGNDRVESITADFADLKSVHGMAVELKDRFPAIHTLVCNAGVLLPVKQTSKDGYEMTLAVNHLAHFLLTSLLLDKIKASGTPDQKARIVAVSSICHSWEPMAFEDLNCERRGYEKYEQYSITKLANMMWIYALSRRLQEEEALVTANVLEPGVIETKLLRNGGFSGSPVSQGARAPIYLASHPDLEGITGKYYSCSCSQISSDAKANSVEDQERLWTMSEELIEKVVALA
mmetsp:Transcript_18104/g.39601  ORF Transcript_18104/g.39601 Transcript_18104/m.39601 type:complete len:290 (-) Transcript_18104:161-1030(-)|eukprot:CAMPEP_0118924308 /NCGR_PEP_ID=MMETSP1169-20130426/2502_1 /TAXON_ID=36882 /ORGANISM="Pyramimonas obovata, Strain CCMP722" /LENGTH=289 /DNA_ID=CAMNT_0006865405 /DNA_START=46 /DNA_END=915 /DNA_ORIENTATION=+